MSKEKMNIELISNSISINNEKPARKSRARKFGALAAAAIIGGAGVLGAVAAIEKMGIDIGALIIPDTPPPCLQLQS